MKLPEFTFLQVCLKRRFIFIGSTGIHESWSLLRMKNPEGFDVLRGLSNGAVWLTAIDMFLILLI